MVSRTGSYNSDVSISNAKPHIASFRQSEVKRSQVFKNLPFSHYWFKMASFYQIKTRLIIFSADFTYIGLIPRQTLRFSAACGINGSQIQIKLRNCIIFLSELRRYTSDYFSVPLCPESTKFYVIYLHVPRLITIKLPYVHAVLFLFLKATA